MNHSDIRKEIQRLEAMLPKRQQRSNRKAANEVTTDDGVRLKLRKGERITIIVGKKPH